MKKVLIVLSSVRPNRIADSILNLVRKELQNYPELEIEVADFRELPLPFVDSAVSPSHEEFAHEDENVIKWAEMVKRADVVLFLTAEYNYSYTGVLKNAIDWLLPEWQDKPVAFVGYGWSGGSRAITKLRELLTGFIQAKPLKSEANLNFMKLIDTEGNTLDEAGIAQTINSVLGEISSLSPHKSLDTKAAA